MNGEPIIGQTVTITYTGVLHQVWDSGDGWSKGSVRLDGYNFTIPQSAIVEVVRMIEPDVGTAITDLQGLVWQRLAGGFWYGVNGVTRRWEDLVGDVVKVIYRP